ncbi:helix-turn-helix transcriptional regulator [Mucisphaera sp.]|uniref:helix-turn-helix transcriptional regulator n=1 Tax=Mucisphaera sp. TaxID=2913024 RepID=UPI003D12FB49
MQSRLDSEFEAHLLHTMEITRQVLQAEMAYAYTPANALTEGRRCLTTGLSPRQASTLNLDQWHTDEASLPLQLQQANLEPGRVYHVLDLPLLSRRQCVSAVKRLNAYRELTDLVACDIPSVHGSLILAYTRWAESEKFQPDQLVELELLLRSLPERLKKQVPRALPAAAKKTPKAIAKLSPTEKVVLTHLLENRTQKEIAEILERSTHTVHVHIKNIYLKHGVHSRYDLLKRLNSS